MRSNRKLRRFKDANGKFVFIRKPAPIKVTPNVHVRSYRHNEKMPEGFSLGLTADIRN